MYIKVHTKCRLFIICCIEVILSIVINVFTPNVYMRYYFTFNIFVLKYNCINKIKKKLDMSFCLITLKSTQIEIYYFRYSNTNMGIS